MKSLRFAILLFAVFVCSADAATNVVLNAAVTDMDRWMYPFNATPGTRPSASVFGTLGLDSGVDTRHAQLVIGWNTSNSVPAGRGVENYVIRHAKVTLTINRDQAWIYDGTQDGFQTYLSTNDTRLQADSDPGRPIELFGTGFRNGFTAATFPENGPFSAGQGLVGTRTAYAAGYDTNGVLVDVSNNVGKADAESFEVKPFAVGNITNMTSGELVSTGRRVEFEINLGDPNVVAYLREALDGGTLRFTVTSLGEAEFAGPATFPQFYTRDNVLATDADKPVLDLDVELSDPRPVQLGVVRAGPDVRLTFSPAPAGPVVIEYSDDLAVWTEKAVMPEAGDTTGVSAWTPPPGGSARFFRLKTQ